MRTHRTRFLIAGGVILVLIALYCGSGYAMNASFSVAHPDSAMVYRKRAVGWLVAGAGCLLIAGICFSGVILGVRRRKTDSEES